MGNDAVNGRARPDDLVVGIDYGTLSGRAVVVRVRDGKELGSAVFEYPHGVMDTELTAGPAAAAGAPQRLPPDGAFQAPAAYVDVLKTAAPAALTAPNAASAAH